MKVMIRKTALYAVAAMLLVCTASCGDALKPTWEYLVDNPLDTEIVIKIDDKEYSIPAGATQAIKITQGKHTLTYNGQSVNFVTKVNSQKSVTVMNPTLSNYLLHANFYVKTNAKNDDVTALYEKNSHEYASDEGVVSLPVSVLNSLFLEKTVLHWTFGLGEEAKEEMRSNVPSGSKRVLYKLYREADYRKDFAENLPSGVVFPANPRALSEQPAYVFPTESLLCDCDAANEFVKELGERLDRIMADPSDVFQDVGRVVYDATASQHSLNQECGKQFNPNRDDTAFKKAMSDLLEVTRYLSDVSAFIVK